MDRLAKVDIKRFETSVRKYVKARQVFESEKLAFTKAAEIFFYLKGGENNHTFQISDDETVTVLKVQKTKISWNISKLRSIIGNKLSRQVINKQYTIVNMPGLIAYLKECGVDPNKFKSFITVDESVNVKELEQLEQLGKIDGAQLKGCYQVKLLDPYYSVRTGKP